MTPTIFQSKFLTIQSLWLFVVIALLISSYLAVKRLKRRRVNFNILIEHSTGCLISALFFSRTFYFFSHTDAYFPAFDLRTLGNYFAIWDQGLSLWGAVLGFTLVLIFHLYRTKEEIWKWMDALLLPALVGYGIGMMGAFMGGAYYGTPTNLFWGVKYETMNVKYTVPIHPVQLYSILAIALLLLGKKILMKKTSFFEREGNTSLYLLTGFSLIFFLLEFLRGDDTLLIQGIRVPFILSGLALLFFGALFFRRLLQHKKSHESTTAA